MHLEHNLLCSTNVFLMCIVTKNPFLTGTTFVTRTNKVPTQVTMWTSRTETPQSIVSNIQVPSVVPSRSDVEPISSSIECGKPLVSIDLVVRGKSVVRGAFPWLVAMFTGTSSGPSLDYRCCGNLVSSKHIITGNYT